MGWGLDIKSAIEHHCNYQPRCHKEVRNKLYELGCKTPEVEQYIAELIAENKLNEEQYARAFARGKFRILNWGKTKIINSLRANQVSEYCIKKGLTEIDEEEYLATLKKLGMKKWTEVKKDRNQFTRKSKMQRYLLQKGFESNLVYELLNEIIRTNSK